MSVHILAAYLKLKTTIPMLLVWFCTSISPYSIHFSLQFLNIFTRVTAESHNVNPPVIPRYRRLPRKLDAGFEPVTETPEVHYRRINCELLDVARSATETHLNQNALGILTDIETVLLSTANGQETDSKLVDRFIIHFKDDINGTKL